MGPTRFISSGEIFNLVATTKVKGSDPVQGAALDYTPPSWEGAGRTATPSRPPDGLELKDLSGPWWIRTFCDSMKVNLKLNIKQFSRHYSVFHVTTLVIIFQNPEYVQNTQDTAPKWISSWKSLEQTSP